ncbi:chondroitin sulfate synthase 1-like [Ctenocephalides felis]|uniref:chondroitin sulfate synthase 1-like n=1 Tax=Ctenocephalides felis TaxID=7515 RepID=UPI000E6E11F3|nr:chondroitin sulfate synthase 1-like [Ctenocephalides felis]
MAVENMQSILHHNSSGVKAFSGNLKTREVHKAISLHPVKKPPLMYRLHAYILSLDIQHEQQKRIDLHMDLAKMSLAVQSYPDKQQTHPEWNVLGAESSLNRYYPRRVEDVISWEFMSKSLFSHTHSNPKRRMEANIREGLNDVVREVMENINTYSRQRGRIIEFRELLYGYQRLDLLDGHDMILDLLLVYKKYRGKKMTVPVRRHAYIQRTFAELEIRETYTDSIKLNSYIDFP